jgi:hypothetical protein
VGSLYYLVLFDRIIQFLPLFAAMLLLFAGALAFALNKLKRRLVMFSRGQLEIQDVEVTSLVDGENLPASLFTCPECVEMGTPLFTVFRIVGQDHVHLQCGYCDASYCTAVECKPPEKKIVIVPG